MKFSNILYPINLNSRNIAAVNRALEIASFFKSRIHLLYVNDEGAGHHYPADNESAVALKVKEIAPVELLDTIEVIYAVSKGKLDVEVINYCKDKNIDLIILAHKHRNRLYSALFDSPDVNIIDNINIPILVIPKN